MPSEGYQRLVRKMFKAPSRLDATVEQSRHVINYTASLFALDADVQVERTEAKGVPAEWLTPPEHEPNAALLYLHGGGYIMGSINTHRHMAGRLAKCARLKTLIIDYRLAPEHAQPAALDDALAAYETLLQHVPAERIVISGDSAGGGLSLALLLRLRDEGLPLPAGAALIAPWTDLTFSGASWKTKADADPLIKEESGRVNSKFYIGGGNVEHPYISPLFGNYEGIPPVLVHVGSEETLLDDSTRLGEQASAHGADITVEVWPGMIHVWQYYIDWFPEAQDSLDQLGAFLNARVSA